MSDDLVAFLRARLDEESDYAQMIIDESESKSAVLDADPPHPWNLMRLFALKRGDELMVMYPARVLAEVESKRRIIDIATGLRLHHEGQGWIAADGEDILYLLAQPYADHPDFDPGWKL